MSKTPNFPVLQDLSTLDGQPWHTMAEGDAVSTRAKGGVIIAVLLVDVDHVVVVVPASNAAIAATAGTFYEEAVGFELNGGRNLGGRITGEV